MGRTKTCFRHLFTFVAVLSSLFLRVRRGLTGLGAFHGVASGALSPVILALSLGGCRFGHQQSWILHVSSPSAWWVRLVSWLGPSDLDLMAVPIFRPTLDTCKQSRELAEKWGVIIAVQASSGIHVGIDNLNVLNGVVRLLAQDNKGPLFGRLRQNDEVFSARRALLRTRRHWYPIMVDLQKFMIAVSRFKVNKNNHDGKGGTAPDAMTWDEVAFANPALVPLRFIVDHACLPGAPGFLDSSCCCLSSSLITQEDVATWPYKCQHPSWVYYPLGLSSFASR